MHVRGKLVQKYDTDRKHAVAFGPIENIWRKHVFNHSKERNLKGDVLIAQKAGPKLCKGDIIDFLIAKDMLLRERKNPVESIASIRNQNGRWQQLSLE